MEVKASASPPGAARRPTTEALCLSDRPPRTFADLIRDRVRGFGDAVFLPRRSAREHEPVTFAQLVTDIDRVAAGLSALGIGRGDRVGLLAENRCEWLVADLAMASIGVVDVPRGSDTSPEEMAFILRHSGAVATFVTDDDTARTVLERCELPAPGRVISLLSRSAIPGVMTLPELMELGRQWTERQPDALEARRDEVQPDDLLTLVYTSGTTAQPKGVMLTHANVLSNIRNSCTVLRITGDDSFLSILPAWHMYERLIDYLALAAGGQLMYTDRRRLKEDLRVLSPTVFAAVPRIWEMIHDGMVGTITNMKGPGGMLMRRVLGLCRRCGAGTPNPLHRVLHALCRATVLRKLRAATGGRLRIAVSGGGALPRHVDECLLGIGLPLLNGYGLTETSPVAAVRRPDRNEPCTIGPPIPETEIECRSHDGHRLGPGETGVLWIRGPQVMRGYYANPEKTAEVLDPEGWFNTGDLGTIREDGHVLITGRAKDTIVLAGGENVEPEPVETAIKTSPLIEQAVVVGQDAKSLGALLVPQADVLEQRVPRTEWDERDGLLHGPRVRELLRGELDRLLVRDNGFRTVERVARFQVLSEPMTVENGMLTPTLKVRRHIVQERLGPVIEEMLAR